MLSDQELIDLMDRAPVPMHVDLDAVVALGRQRRQRRRAVVVGSGLLAAAAAAVGVFAATTDLGRRSADPTVPAVNPTVQVPDPAPREDRSGSARVTTARSSWTIAVERDVLTATPADGSVDPVRAGVGGAAWRVVGASSSHPEIVGVVPGRADRVVLDPPAGGTLPRHDVTLAWAGYFTAFVATFDAPLGTGTPVADVGWSLRGSEVGWALGEDRATTLLAVSMTGEGSGALPPYDSFRTGPASPPAGGADVVVSVDLASMRLGAPLVTSLQEGSVSDPEHLQATLAGLDPETAAGWSAARLVDGRTLVWGVLPRLATRIGLDVSGSAKAGVAVSQDVLDHWTVFAVLVEGEPADVTGVHATLPASGRLDVRATR